MEYIIFFFKLKLAFGLLFTVIEVSKHVIPYVCSKLEPICKRRIDMVAQLFSTAN